MLTIHIKPDAIHMALFIAMQGTLRQEIAHASIVPSRGSTSAGQVIPMFELHIALHQPFPKFLLDIDCTCYFLQLTLVTYATSGQLCKLHSLLPVQAISLSRCCFSSGFLVANAKIVHCSRHSQNASWQHPYQVVILSSFILDQGPSNVWTLM